MEKIKKTEGDLVARDARFVIVAARFNDFVVESLIKGAIHALRQHGVADADMEIVRVPGAIEMPIVVDKLAASRRADGIIALGAVIRGGTPHFDFVAGECVRGLSAAGQKHGGPVGFGVETFWQGVRVGKKADRTVGGGERRRFSRLLEICAGQPET